MKQRNQKPQSPGITLSDILFALFKHKWIILFCAVLGIGGGVAIFTTRKPLYESRARLMVHYVIDSNQVDDYETKTHTGGRSGDSIMQAEIAILTSWDLVAETAQTVGAERIVPETEKAALESAAAVDILERMQVSAARGGNVLDIGYSHEDPEVAREVLKDLVSRYFEKHLEVHRGGDGLDLVTQRADLDRTQLRQIEDELNKKKQEAGIISLPEATASLEAERARIGAELLDSEVALASQIARVKSYEALLGIESGDDGGAAPEGASKPESGVAKADPPTSAEEPAHRAGIHVLTEYKTLMSRLAYLDQRQFELEMKFRGGKLIELNKSEIARLHSQLDELVKNNPGLMETARADQMARTDGPDGPDLVSLRAELAALQARAAMLRNQQTTVQKSFDSLASISSEIEGLERRRKVESDKFQHSQTSLGKARIDDALDATKIPNISFIQRPTPPAKTYDRASTKIAAGVSVFGLLFGVGIALLLELVVDHRVKRPMELQSRFRIPLMMSIPRIGAQERNKYLALDSGLADEEGRMLAKAAARGEVSPLDHRRHFINPYADAVRDRLGYYFELNNMTHKPKLIALTGLSAGAGTTTLAAGVAAAFAEIDDSKVLYLDMNSFQEGEGDTLKVKNANSLKETLQSSREFGLNVPGDNLYVATMPTSAGGAGSKRLATKKFYDLMPKFRASQFDYIIFDMPPLGSTSPTTAMTGFMDQVILVLDAQNTDRDLLQQGYADLAKGNADVTCVFNKARSHAPRWVQGAA